MNQNSSPHSSSTPTRPSPRLVIPLERLCGAAGAEKLAFAHTHVSRPMVPDLSPVLHSLEPDHERYREPENGELVLGLYRQDDGSAAPILLWADPKVDLFWDVSLRQHVKAPTWYVRLNCQPQIDPASGYPVVEGAVCPF